MPQNIPSPTQSTVVDSSSTASKSVDTEEKYSPMTVAVNNSANIVSCTSMFTFSLAKLSIKTFVPLMTRNDFTSVEYLGNGSNSFVYSAYCGGGKVVIKMLKAQVKDRKIAEQEMLFEIGILARLKHPNIIGIRGAGSEPRKFIVLENLSGGTLGQLLNPDENNDSDAGNGYNNPSKSPFILPLSNIIFIARELASAIHYLHSQFHEQAMVIHRGRNLFSDTNYQIIFGFLFLDLKPENIGFTEDGQLRLFDFGLMACVRKRTSLDEAYKMTGNTGTLVYMAPEVALRKAYNEKVDIYSFGIILWQMTSGEIPYALMKRDEYMVRVVHNGYRLKIRDDLPGALISLIESCWDANPAKRPDSAELLSTLNYIVENNLTKYRTRSLNLSLSKVFQKGHKVADETTVLALSNRLNSIQSPRSNSFRNDPLTTSSKGKSRRRTSSMKITNIFFKK